MQHSMGDSADPRQISATRRGTFPMCGGSVERPPQGRLSTKFVGLANQGATCYLNSLLQTCFMTPEIRETIFSVGPADLHYEGALKGEECAYGELYMPCELQRLLAYMQAADVDGLQTDALTHSFGWRGGDTGVHHDLQELMRILFDHLEESLPLQFREHIKSIYTGSWAQEVRCLKCGSCSILEEVFGDLNVPVDGFSGIEQSLTAFTTPESLTGDNRYQCEKCNELVNAQKQVRLRKLSQVMILSLGRFRFNWERDDPVREKITDRFTFPLELDFKEYTEPQALGDQSTRYELFSVIIHKGGANSGHYHAIIKDLHGQGVWNAAESAPTSAFGAANSVAGCGGKKGWAKFGAKLGGVGDDVGGAEYVVESYVQRPELLIRDIITQFESMSGSNTAKGMPFKQIDTEITEQTGVPWNTRYKPTHGTIRDFVESKPHFFDVKDAVVSVVEGATWNENPPPTQRALVPTSPAPAASAWASGSGGAGSASAKSWAQLAAKPAPAECTEKCWFDFNDMTITPVSVKELEKYCEGSECAYVLFYRRKSAALDSAPAKKAMPNLPPHMQGEIDEFNRCLQSSRVMYAERMSQVKVTCYPGSSLSFDGVVLRPTPTGRPFEITIDRRNSLAHAKDKVYEALCQQQTASNYPEVQAGRSAVALHLLRRCIAPSTLSGNDCSMHVYDLVGPEHEDSTPLGTRVKEGLNILLWDGTGEYLGWEKLNLCVGPEAEAMVLSVSYLIQSFVPRDTAPAAGRSPEAKGVWGGAGASAVGIVSGIVGLAGEEEADGPPPDGVMVLARKDWKLKDLRRILGDLLQQREAQTVGIEPCQVMIHRLDRAQTLGGKQPLRLDPMDDDKTLGELQLKEAKGCRLAVEIAPTAVWQEPRAFKAFKWTQGGLTRVTVQLPIPDSPSVLQTDLDVDWDSILSDVKKRATSLLKEKIKALSPAQQHALAGSQKSNAALGAKEAKKEMRLVFQSASWGEQGFPVTDETASLRDIYQPYSTFDDEADVAPLPVKVVARLMPTTSSVGAAAHMPETQVGPVEVRTCLVKDGKRSMEVKVHLQREMLLPQCREVLARALKVEHAASDYHMRSTNWAGDAADDVDEDETITFGSIMHTLNIKERDLILLERGAPRKALQSGFVRISVWHHVPTARSTLLAECDAMQACNRPDGQVLLHDYHDHLVISQEESIDALRTKVWGLFSSKLVHSSDAPTSVQGAERCTSPPENLILRHRDTAGRVRQVLRNPNQSVVKSKLSNCGASLHIVVQMLVDSQALGSPPDSAATAAAKALTEGSVLMYIARRNCKERIYETPREVILACGPNPRLSDVMDLAGKATGIVPDDVVLAKFVVCKDGRCEWKRLDAVANSKNGKCNYSKVLVRGEPIKLTDGDVIAVKSRSDDPDSRDDFFTIQGVLSEKHGSAKGSDKGANGKERPTETPITMVVKKPSRPSLLGGAGLSPAEPGAIPCVASASMGEAESEAPVWRAAGFVNDTMPLSPTSTGGSRFSGFISNGGGHAGLPHESVFNTNTAGSAVGIAGGCAELVGAQMNGTYHDRKEAPQAETEVVQLLMEIFPGLSLNCAIGVDQEYVAALKC